MAKNNGKASIEDEKQVEKAIQRGEKFLKSLKRLSKATDGPNVEPLIAAVTQGLESLRSGEAKPDHSPESESADVVEVLAPATKARRSKAKPPAEGPDQTEIFSPS